MFANPDKRVDDLLESGELILQKSSGNGEEQVKDVGHE